MLTRFLLLFSLGFAGCAPQASSPPAQAPDETPQPASSPASTPALEDSASATSASEEKPNVAAALELEGKDTVLRGTIGDAAVMMELRVAGDQVGGRYYYEKYKHSILLQGTLVDGRLALTEFVGKETEAFGPAKGKLEAQREAGALVGTWTSRDGKKSAPLRLTPDPEGDYHALRVDVGKLQWAEDRAFAYRSVQHFDEHLVYCGETAKPLVSTSLIPGLHEECFHLFEGPAGFRAVYETNEILLDQLHPKLKTESTRFGRSIPEPGEGWGGETRLEVIYARGRVLTILSTTSGLYLGAYPGHDSSGFTVDLRTGEHATLEKLLDIQDNGAFMRELEAQVPANPIGVEKEYEKCHWSDNWVQGNDFVPVTAHITDQGLHLTPQFPHVMKPCQYDNIGRLAPRAFAEKYARKGGLLDLTLAGKWGP